MNNVDNSKELPTVLSLCTGYGGIERGLELAGLEHRVVAHVEIEAFAAANLVSKMEDGKLVPAPVWTNLKTLPVEVFRDRVSILTGGYPCQPFSSAGKRLGEEDPRHLWPYILDIIKAIRPVRCFFENVEGHISLGLREVVSDLESLGYKVAWGIFSAREVGAPHQRKRVYIMADSNNGQRELKDKEIRTGRDASVDGGKYLADSGGSDDEGSELGDSQHNGLSASTFGRGANPTSNNTAQGQNEASKFERASKPNSGSDLSGAYILADSDSTRLRQSDQEDARQSSEQSDSGGFQSGNAANANSEGLEGRLQRGSVDTQGRQEQEIRYAAQRSNWRGGRGHSTWPPEPSVGRVVDGCANRVDRIRLLGNGVVPQTAAKAWLFLCAELQLKSDETTIA